MLFYNNTRIGMYWMKSSSWNLETLYHTIFRHLDSRYHVPVIFCSIREANKIISDLGDDEEEYLRFASAIYWRESRIIFKFDYDEYTPVN